MACTTLERTSGFEPSSETIAYSNFEACDSTQMLFFYFGLPLNVLSSFVISLLSNYSG